MTLNQNGKQFDDVIFTWLHAHFLSVDFVLLVVVIQHFEMLSDWLLKKKKKSIEQTTTTIFFWGLFTTVLSIAHTLPLFYLFISFLFSVFFWMSWNFPFKIIQFLYQALSRLSVWACCNLLTRKRKRKNTKGNCIGFSC